MIEIDDINFVQYIELQDRDVYDYCINYSFTFNKPVDIFGIGDIMKLPFGTVKDIQYDLQNGLTWEQFFEYIFKITGKNVIKESLLKLCQQRSYLVKSMEELINVESIALASETTGEEDQAGMNEFEGFGIELQLRSLTGGDVTKKEQVRKCVYEDCFVELVLQKKISDYEKRLFEIRKRKNN